jgi:hypothetical protein
MVFRHAQTKKPGQSRVFGHTKLKKSDSGCRAALAPFRPALLAGRSRWGFLLGNRLTVFALPVGSAAVPVGIPPSPLELEGADGNQFLHRAPAIRAFAQGFIGHALLYFEHIFAGFAFVFINRHLSYLFTKKFLLSGKSSRKIALFCPLQ